MIRCVLRSWVSLEVEGPSIEIGGLGLGELGSGPEWQEQGEYKLDDLGGSIREYEQTAKRPREAWVQGLAVDLLGEIR